MFIVVNESQRTGVMIHKLDDDTGQALVEIVDVWIRAKALDAAMASFGVSDRNPARLPEIVAKAVGLEIYIRDGGEAWITYVENGGVV